MTPNLLNGEPPAGPSAGTASSIDVADALRVMRSRSPEESLGVKTHRGLLKSSVQAGIITAILFAALTAGPYAWGKVFPPAPKGQKPATAETTTPKDTPATSPTSATSPEAVAKKSPDAPTVPGKTPGKKDFTDVLGESGSKKGSPADPFGKGADDLLKDLK